MNHRHEDFAPVELGTASEATLGAKGYSTDLVREIPGLGLSDD
jgi:hypothetical protein